MRMVFTRPALALVWLGLACLLAAMASTWYLLQQPSLGVTLRVSDAGDKVLVANTAPHLGRSIPLGVQLLRLTSATGNTVELVVTDLIEEPDFLDTYAEMAEFFSRQSSLAAHFGADSVTLDWRDSQGAEGKTVVLPQPRQLSSVPVAFWFQLGVGFLALLISAWVFFLRPDYWGTRLFALTGLFFPIATTSAAIYSSRELALPGEVFRALSSINHGGSILFGCALVGLFLVYPKPFVRPRILLWIPVVFVSWWLADAMRWAPDQNWGSRLPVLLELKVAIGFGLMQWRASRFQPLDRAALRWFALSSLTGACLFVLTMYLPRMLGTFSPLPQAYAFAFFLVMYIGIALGLSRYRLFDLDEWAFRIFLWLISAATVVLMDTALLYIGLGQGISLGFTLLLCGALYFPFRQWLWQRMLNRHEASIEQLLPEVLKIIFIVDKAEQEAAWSALLRHFFNPLEMESEPSHTLLGEIQESGLVMLIPQCGNMQAKKLRYAGHGARLFSSRDVQFTTALCHLMSEMMSGRNHYEQGVMQERLRIGRDLHDNIGARLLKMIHQLRGTPTADVARDAMKDLRTAIAALDAQPVPLSDALADWHAEAEGRCESVQCELSWKQPSSTPSVKLAPRTKASLESVMRELITNALKHATPQHIQIEITWEKNILRVSVSNDGHIGDPLAWNTGYGLRNMRGRMDELGGNLSTDTGLDNFVRLTLSVAVP